MGNRIDANNTSTCPTHDDAFPYATGRSSLGEDVVMGPGGPVCQGSAVEEQHPRGARPRLR